MQQQKEIKERDVGGESGAWVAESSCSVTAALFTQPVSPVFVTPDVSIKTGAVTKNKPTPPPTATNRTATTTPRAPRHLSPATLPQTPPVFSPSSLWRVHTNQRVRLSPGPRSKYKSQGAKKSSEKEWKLGGCSCRRIFLRFGDGSKRWKCNQGLLSYNCSF